MLCFSGFELYSRWVPLMFGLSEKKSGRCMQRGSSCGEVDFNGGSTVIKKE